MGVPSDSLLLQLRARFMKDQQNGCPSSEPNLVKNAVVPVDAEARAEVREWLDFSSNVSLGKLQVLNVYLQPKSVIIGLGIQITIADIAVFVSVRNMVANLSLSEQESLPNLLRWFDYVQHKEDVQEVYGLIPISKPQFDFLASSTKAPGKTAATKPMTDAEVAKPLEQNIGRKDKISTVSDHLKDGNDLKSDAMEKGQTAKKTGLVENKVQKNEEKKAKEKKEKLPAQKKEVDCSIDVLDIRVGCIKKVWKHPNADALYVEEIDIGEARPRQIVSGLAKYLSEGEMQDRRVLVLTNVKPGNVRDVLSSGLVLCASNADHSQCEPLRPPDEAKIGEKVIFKGYDGKSEDILNPKKKQWEKIIPDLHTDAEGQANYQGIPFMTSAGPCKSTIVNGNIK